VIEARQIGGLSAFSGRKTAFLGSKTPMIMDSPSL
jgi:hypothetical protein